MTTPQCERRPQAEAPSTGIASHQAAESTSESTSSVDWSARAAYVAAWLPTASREAVEAFAWRHYQRAEGAAWCIAEQHRRDDLTAQRMASYAVCEAEDWTAASRRPSYAELQRRRGEVA